MTSVLRPARAKTRATTPSATRAATVLAACLLGVATACGGGTAGDPAPPTTAPGSSGPVPGGTEPGEPSTPPPTPAPTGSAPAGTTPPLPEGFSADEQRSDSWPRLGPRVGTGVEVRVGRHETYDRVVYEFSGLGRPTYRVLWVDEPVDQGAGEVVEVPGDSYLSVTATTVEIPEEDDPSPREPSASSLDGTVVVSAAPIWGGYEGYGEQFIGVRGEPRPFRVSVLEEPTRLVVDIAR